MRPRARNSDQSLSRLGGLEAHGNQQLDPITIDWHPSRDWDGEFVKIGKD